MLYHHITHSDDTRIVKKIMTEQQNSLRKGTWYHGVTLLITRYKINIKVGEVKKSTWKHIVKENIRKVTEMEIKSCCEGKSKSRSVVTDEYKMKNYLKESTTSETTRILKMRLHMTNIPCNYNQGEKARCWLCGTEDVRSEHYFVCPEITNNWNAKEEDVTSKNIMDLQRASKFMEEVEMRNIRYQYGKLI